MPDVFEPRLKELLKESHFDCHKMENNFEKQVLEHIISNCRFNQLEKIFSYGIFCDSETIEVMFNQYHPSTSFLIHDWVTWNKRM